MATQVFTKETLPVGSKIVVAEGWQYRPEGWIIDEDGGYTGSSSASPRPENVTTSEVIVDEDWWENYTHRGFNISLIGATTDISGYSEEQINTAFKIYVPKTN